MNPHYVIGAGNGGLSGGDPSDLVNEVVSAMSLPAVRGGGGRGHGCGRDG